MVYRTQVESRCVYAEFPVRFGDLRSPPRTLREDALAVFPRRMPPPAGPGGPIPISHNIPIGKHMRHCQGHLRH